MPRQQMQMVMSFTHIPGQFQPNPPGIGGYTVTRWADWTVIPALHVVNDALFTGDLRWAHQYFDSLVEWHLYKHMINASDTLGAGLVVDNQCAGDPDSCLSCLIDTSGGSDDGYQQSHANAVVQAWVYYAMTQVAQLGRWIGKLDVARELDVKAAAMKKRFNQLMINDAGVVCDGICTEINHTSIHASFYALAFDIVDTPHQQKVFAYIKTRIDSSPLGFPGGSYPIQFLLVALYATESDRGNLAYEVLSSEKKHGWIAMMRDHNATTTMECWSPDELPNLSFSHIWSASPAFIIPWYLAGVRPTAPGFSTLDIKPQPGPLTQFAMVMPTVKGPVHSNVTQTFDATTGELSHFKMLASIPGNVAARLHAPNPPTKNSTCLRLNGQRVEGFKSRRESYIFVEVGSGTHTLGWCEEGL